MKAMKNIRNPIRPLLLGILGLLEPGPTVRAATYDLASFPWQYENATIARARLTTSEIGRYDDRGEIEAIFNSSKYEAELHGSGVLTQMDNANSRWLLELSSPGNSASLIINSEGMSLSFVTPAEYSDGVLMLRDGTYSVLQYRQSNNVTDENFAHFGFYAVHGAYSPSPFGTTFFFPAVKAPDESSALVLLCMGVVGFFVADRRSGSKACLGSAMR